MQRGTTLAKAPTPTITRTQVIGFLKEQTEPTSALSIYSHFKADHFETLRILGALRESGHVERMGIAGSWKYQLTEKGRA
jgi:Fe2+ or Zn2+ uptake regulation protein